MELLTNLGHVENHTNSVYNLSAAGLPDGSLQDHTYSPVDSNSDLARDNGLFHFYASGIVGSLFVLLGIVGNLLSVCVLNSKRMRSGSVSVCRILVGLAVYDSVFLFSHGLAGNLPHVLHHTGHNMGSSGNIIFVTMYPILHMSRTGSVYTTVTVTIERCIAVIKPLKAAIIFTQTRTNKILIAIFIFSVLFNIPRCMEHVLLYDSGAIIAAKSAFHDTLFFHTVYLIYFNFVFHFAVPFALIAIFNALMVYTLRKVTRPFNKSEKSNVRIQLNAKTGNRPSCEIGNKLSAIVLAVTSMFFLCHLVPAVALVLEQTENADRLGECSAVCSRISSLGETLIIVCSATNFILYCLFGRKFRMVSQSLFCPCVPVGMNQRNTSKKSMLHSMKSVTETNA